MDADPADAKQTGEAPPVVLAYMAPARPRRLPWRVLLNAACVALIVGAAHWHTADWYAYVQNGPDGTWRPKFEMPVGWKIAECTVSSAWWAPRCWWRDCT